MVSRFRHRHPRSAASSLTERKLANTCDLEDAWPIEEGLFQDQLPFNGCFPQIYKPSRMQGRLYMAAITQRKSRRPKETKNIKKTEKAKPKRPKKPNRAKKFKDEKIKKIDNGEALFSTMSKDSTTDSTPPSTAQSAKKSNTVIIELTSAMLGEACLNGLKHLPLELENIKENLPATSSNPKQATSSLSSSQLKNVHWAKLPDAHAQCNITSRHSLQGTEPKVPLFSPLYLPYSARHIILNKAQRNLEQACYDFAAKWLPDMLKDSQFECPEAAELTLWTRSIRDRIDQGQAPQLMLETLHLDIKENLQVFDRTLDDIKELRHTAVHRLKIGSDGVSILLSKAIDVATVLGGSLRAENLRLLRETVVKMEVELEGNRARLQSQLKHRFQEIDIESATRSDLLEQKKVATAVLLAEYQQARRDMKFENFYNCKSIETGLPN